MATAALCAEAGPAGRPAGPLRGRGSGRRTPSAGRGRSGWISTVR